MQTTAEQRALKLSIATTLLVGMLGVATGLFTGSQAIVFDGMYSFVDVLITIASLAVAKLLAREGSRHFQYGFSHLEPMVGAFGGAILALACIYAVINAVNDLLAGGHEVAYGFGALWAAIQGVVGAAMAIYIGRQSKRLQSGLLALDCRSWLISSALSLAVLIGFLIAAAIRGTSAAHWIPYIDSIVLLCTALAMLPVPLAAVGREVREVLQVAPGELDARVTSVMAQIVAEHGFAEYSSYVLKFGRTHFIEIHVLVGPSSSMDIAKADSIRRDISARLGAEGTQYWLSVDFTAERRWL